MSKQTAIKILIAGIFLGYMISLWQQAGQIAQRDRNAAAAEEVDR